MQPNPHANAMQIDLPSNVLLVSKADLEGNIKYANEAFAQISGYSQQELLGQPHRMLRHPDVPEAVFTQLWSTLRSGIPWQGILKNTCKNGSFYWTSACIVPIRRNDQITGYMSVFKPAQPQEIEIAQTAFSQNKAPELHRRTRFRIRHGVRTGVRIGYFFIALLILTGGVLGVGGLKMSDAAFTRLYKNQFEPAAAIGQVEARLREIRTGMLEMQPNARVAPNGIPARQSIANLQNTYDEIQEIFSGVKVAESTADVASVSMANALLQYTQEARTLLNRAATANPNQLDIGTQKQLLDLENKATLSAHALRQALMEEAQQEFSDTLQRNAQIRMLAVLGIIAGLLLTALMAQRFIRLTLQPLNAAIDRLHRIAQGDLQSEVRISGAGETAQLNQAAVVMQQHLQVMIDEIAVASRRIQQQCQKLNQSLYGVTEHSEAQHDQVHAAIRALNNAVAETSDLSQRAERLMQMASTAETAGDVTTSLETETRELATATRLAAFGAEEVAGSMRQVANLIVENRGEAQLAWQASEELMRTANELNHLVDFFEPHKQKMTPATMP